MNHPSQQSELSLFRSAPLESRREIRGLLELAGILSGNAEPFLLLTAATLERPGLRPDDPVTGGYQAAVPSGNTTTEVIRSPEGEGDLRGLPLPGSPCPGFLCFRSDPFPDQQEKLALICRQLSETLELIFGNARADGAQAADAGREDKLRKAEKEIQKLSLMARETRTGIIITDQQMMPTWVNRAFETLLGYGRKELLGRDVLEMVIGHHPLASKSLGIIRERLKRKNFRGELLIYRKDGTPVWVSTFSAPLFDDLGKLESMVTMVVDITAEKKKEEQLRTLSLVASRSVTGAAVNDPEGNAFWVNKAFEEQSGYTLEELRGKKIGDVLAGPETDLGALEEARRLSRLKRPYEVELLNYKKDGTPFWVKVSGNPVLDQQGNITHQVEIMNDITLRKLSELELIRTREDALKLSRAKEMFFSVMSHEIRTPLNSILGITQLLLDDSPRADQAEMLNLLKFAGENLRTLINDILDLTKMETGHLRLEKTPVSLRELSEQTVRSMSARAAENSTQLVLHADPDLPAAVLADPVRLYQVLINLVGNAIKFTPGGTVTVTLDLVRDAGRTAEVQFTVSDTGIGIPQDKLEHIFQPYSQASADTTRKYGGTGLGLAIVRNLLHMHGTSVRVSSEPGKGSAFTFAMKFRKSGAAARQQTGPAMAASGSW